MRVIQNNFKAHEEKKETISCPNCASIIEYTEADLTHRFSRTEGWTQSTQRYVGFKCPCCNYEVGIKDA